LSSDGGSLAKSMLMSCQSSVIAPPVGTAPNQSFKADGAAAA